MFGFDRRALTLPCPCPRVENRFPEVLRITRKLTAAGSCAACLRRTGSSRPMAGGIRQRFDVLLQLRPACEPIDASNCKLGFGEFCGRLPLPQFAEHDLRLFFKVFEIRKFGQIAKHKLLLYPGVRTREKRGSCSDQLWKR